MNFGFSEEQEELRRLVRRFLEEKSPEPEVRRLMATPEGYDPAVWRQMADQLGLQAMIIPEEDGGAGFGYVELCVVLEEMGAALLCAPYFSTVALAANALLTSDDEGAKKAYLPGIANGTTIATLAMTNEAGSWELDATGVTAAKSGDGYTLSGVKSYVIDGATADLILVTASTPEGLSLFAVDASAAGLERQPLATMDQTRKQAKLTFTNTPARIIGKSGAAGPGLEKAIQKACAALAAEQVGGAQRVLNNSVEYAKTRVQFGRPIGSFQAIKHKLADLLLEVELAKSAAYYAAQAAAANDPEWPALANLAKAATSETYIHAAAECIQIHGGIGFTWDNDTHLWFKRAKSSEVFLGQPSYHRELLMRRWGV